MFAFDPSRLDPLHSKLDSVFEAFDPVCVGLVVSGKDSWRIGFSLAVGQGSRECIEVWGMEEL